MGFTTSEPPIASDDGPVGFSAALKRALVRRFFESTHVSRKSPHWVQSRERQGTHAPLTLVGGVSSHPFDDSMH